MSTLRANQVLHGYRDGHRLLQSSIKLSPEGQALLLANSDATGPAVPQGFDTYLSGFSLAVDQVYVFARTWFAHEMARPGCVWTHSLIVDWKSLQDFDDYSAILRAFRRPAEANINGFADYGVPIAISERWVDSHAHGRSPQLSAAIAALYSDDRRAIVFAAERSDLWDDAVIRLWSSQWWTLRRSLTFCTGQLSERPGTRRVDIQVVPQERRFRWRQSDATLIDDSDTWSGPTWVREAERAIFTGKPIDANLDADLRESLPPERSAGPVVLEIARALADSTVADTSSLLDTISRRYPEPTSAVGLKRALLGEHGVLWKRAVASGSAGSELARYLLFSEHGHAFDRSAISLRRHLERIWRSDKADASLLLTTALHGDAFEAIDELVRSASVSLSDHSLIQLAMSDPGAIHALLRSRPSLLSQKDLWRGSAQVRREMAAALVRAGADHPTLVPRGIAAAVDAGAVDSLAELVRRAELPVFAEIVVAVLNLLPSVPGWQAYSVVAALRSRAIDLIRLWQEGVLDANSGTVCLMTVFEPTAYYGRVMGPELIMRIARQDAEVETSRVQCVGPTFALVAAFDADGWFLLDAAVAAFPRVYAVAVASSLDQWSLSALDHVLPHLGWARDWDICERLRLAAAERLIEQRWPLSVLFRLLPGIAEFEWLLHTICGQRHGRHLIKEAARLGAGAGATDAQLKAVENVL